MSRAGCCPEHEREAREFERANALGTIEPGYNLPNGGCVVLSPLSNNRLNESDAVVEALCMLVRDLCERVEALEHEATNKTTDDY